MKYLFAAILVAASFASFSAANAAGGCGPGFHRGPYGGCQPNRGRVVVVAPRPVYVAPRRAVVRAPVVVVRPGRVCRYGRCR
ncbi:MAG: GCG_CRPN prefix-to-repeats domain-containing protein [Bradyrhizobium sp.]